MRRPTRETDQQPNQVSAPGFSKAIVRYASPMLYTILIVLAIVALLLFIFGYRSRV